MAKRTIRKSFPVTRTLQNVKLYRKGNVIYRIGKGKVAKKVARFV